MGEENTENHITINSQQDVEELKREYNKALDSNNDVFHFQGKEIFVGYAKYMLESINTQWFNRPQQFATIVSKTGEYIVFLFQEAHLSIIPKLYSIDVTWDEIMEWHSLEPEKTEEYKKEFSLVTIELVKIETTQ